MGTMSPLYLSFFTIQAINAVLNPFLQVMLRNSGYSYEMIGGLYALYEAFGIVGPLTVGAVADRTGKYKTALLACTVGCAAACIPVALATSLPFTILGLFFVAFCIRAMFPLQDTIATNVLHNDAGKYTRMRAFGTLGYIIFNLLLAATSFPRVDSNRSILQALLIGCGIFFVTTLAMPRRFGTEDTGALADRRIKMEHDPQSRGKWFDAAFLIGLAAIGFSRISMAAVTSFLSLYMVEELGIDQVSFLTAIGAISEILMMLYSGYLLQRKRVEPITLIMLSGVGMFARLLIYAYFPSYAGVFCGQLLHSLGFGALHPAAVLFVARRVRKVHRGVGMSMYISLATSLPAVIGSSLGGILTYHYGYRTMFVVLAMFNAISVGICIGFRKTLTRPPLETYEV
jgi:PPP family 3-phenylpropionic acid transporter